MKKSRLEEIRKKYGIGVPRTTLDDLFKPVGIGELTLKDVAEDLIAVAEKYPEWPEVMAEWIQGSDRSSFVKGFVICSALYKNGCLK